METLQLLAQGLAVAAQPVRERLVDLEQVEIELLQHRQRRVARAEIVDQQPDAQRVHGAPGQGAWRLKPQLAGLRATKSAFAD